MGFGAGMGLPNIKSCSDQMKLESTEQGICIVTTAHATFTVVARLAEPGVPGVD